MYEILEPVTPGYQGMTIIKFLESQICKFSTAQGSDLKVPPCLRVKCMHFQIHNINLQIQNAALLILH